MLTLLLVTAAHAETASAVVTRMKSAWDALQSYRTRQTIQERVRGDLLPEQRMKVAFRKPWEIQLDWETVHEGRRVYWCACQHDGTVQVYPGGLAGRTVGILSFSLDSSILKRDTNYTPKDAGFGSLVSMVYNAVSGNAQTGALTETSVNGQRAWEFEMSAFTHPRLAKATVAVSETTGLPVRLVGWNAAGELTEKYSWYDTEVNPSLSDADFPTGYAE